MKKLTSILTIIAVLIFSTYTAKAQCDDDAKHAETKSTKVKHAKSDCELETAKVAVIKFHADQCGACKKLEPKISELKSVYKDKDVVFVVFNFTDEDSKKKTRAMAKEHGLEQVLDTHKGTGFLVVYDLQNKKEVGTLKNSQKVDEMETKINAYL